MFLQDLGGLVIGGRFLVACSWWFWWLVCGRLARGHFGAVREIGGFVGARGHWRGGVVAVIVWRGRGVRIRSGEFLVGGAFSGWCG